MAPKKKGHFGEGRKAQFGLEPERRKEETTP